ncbi:hypothetical protein DR864_27165 [Runella rosea]|uniref:Uncharacterized protein n=1 Tax=Runella rosea TaxID=2259595 RepID=A0A344TR82_9BACT|nr:hypothetical protein [Runella rosea]AXE21153.1 hypothetical protein DR864_27165 [Runella rosea]
MDIHSEIQAALAESRAARQEAENYLILNGETVNLAEWVTAKEYARRFDIESTNVVTNWIRRGVIPPENVRIIHELNDIRLIKAIPYKESA